MTGQKSPATFFVFLFDLKAEKNDVAAVGKGWMRSDVPPKTALLKCMRRQTWDIFYPRPVYSLVKEAIDSPAR